MCCSLVFVYQVYLFFESKIILSVIYYQVDFLHRKYYVTVFFLSSLYRANRRKLNGEVWPFSFSETILINITSEKS